MRFNVLKIHRRPVADAVEISFEKVAEVRATDATWAFKVMRLMFPLLPRGSVALETSGQRPPVHVTPQAANGRQ